MRSYMRSDRRMDREGSGIPQKDRYLNRYNRGRCRVVRCIMALLLISCAASMFQGDGIEAEAFQGGLALTDSSYEEKLAEAEEKKNKLEKRKKKAQDKLAELQEAKENILVYIDELDTEMNAVTLELLDLQQQVRDTGAELEITREELASAQENEAEQYETMQRRIQYMYENESISYEELIMSSKSITDMLNQAEYVYRITEYDSSLLEKYMEAKEKVEEKEAYLDASLENLKALEETAQFEKDNLQELVDAKAQEIENYTENIGITTEMLFTYADEIVNQERAIEDIVEEEQQRLEEEERRRKEEEERLRKEEEERKRREEEERLAREEEERLRKEEEERLAREQEAQGTESAGNDGGQDEAEVTSVPGYDSAAIDGIEVSDSTAREDMIWPLPGDYRVYDRFGPRDAPTAGASTYHRGWDIGGEFGAPVVAVLAGTVLIADKNSSAGNYVRIDHGDGLITVYCHFSQLLVQQGDYVQQGQQIGLVGSTGVSTGPHLHFGVISRDIYVDPAPFIEHLM